MTQERSPESPGYDIAVVGLSLHFPGARTPEQFWRNLAGGVESIRDLSEDELEKAGVRSAVRARPNYVRRGVVLEDMESFDAAFFGFSPKDAAIADPQHRHFLECAWEALEDAGHPPESFRGSVGVFAGSGMAAYMAFNLLSNPDLVDEVGLFLLRHTANDKDFLATRVSYALDLRGPSINVQTACSTSLVAIHAACQSLMSGECDMALAGGSSILLPHRTGYLFQEGEILSPDGRCRVFEKRSKGTVFGSGSGIVVLRRLDDALKDGDNVRAVIRGSAVNNDGSMKAGYLAPSVDGQAEAILQAIGVSGIPADTIGYVEAHGTGTAVGDPIEVAALTQAFRASTQKRGFCALASVKPNIGHLDTAAGVASFIKVTLALERRVIPPCLHFEEANPEIDFAASPFHVPKLPLAWDSSGTPRRAGVSSLGVGGTNAHAILEESPQRAPTPAARPWQVLTLSARSQAALDRAALSMREHVREHPEQNFADVAWTLQIGRRAFPWRRSFAARDVADAASLLEKPDPQRVATNHAPSEPDGIVFLLPGGGAQYPAMARGLYESEPVFRGEVDACLALLETELRAPELCSIVRRVLLPEAGAHAAAAKELERPAVQLPALFIVEYALARTWIAHGIAPKALLGHSMGENTAACLAGVIELQGALGLVVLRGKLFEKVRPGGMLSVPLPADELRALLGAGLAPGLSLAVENAPGLCVASGESAAIDRLEKELLGRGVEASRIHIAIAAHSELVEPILPEFRAYLRSLALSAPRIPFVSNSTGTWITDAQATDPEYWVRHLRGTVRFSEGVRTAMTGKKNLFLEVGPGNTLCSLVRLHGDAAFGKSVVPSLRHRDDPMDDVAFFRGTLGRLWTLGARPDWSALQRGDARRRVPLPTYPFERQRYWIEPGTSAAATSGERAGPLEKTAAIERWFHAPAWRRSDLPRAETTTAARWLLFMDEGGLGDELAQRLVRRGHEVVCVREGDAFERAADGSYRIVPQEREHYARLWEELAREEPLPTRIAHLWMVTHSEETAVTTTFFHWVQERGFYSLLFVGQALAGNVPEQGLKMWVVSNGMQSVSGEPLPHPPKALVLGPCRVMPKEIAGVACTSVDVALPAAVAGTNGAFAHGLGELAERLANEMCGCAPDEVIALRGADRFVHALEPLALPSETPASNVRQRGVYWITGGLGGIGLALAEHLAREHKAKLVLSGASPVPAREDWARCLERGDASAERVRKLLQLEALGAEVCAVQADVANIEEMRRALAVVRERFGAIHGIVHAAGRLEDGLLQTKDPASVDRVFTPKVHGTLLLDELLREEKLDFFVVFSSTSATLGPPGQIDYAAANAFLQAFARSRELRGGGRTLAIGWGVWQQVGMAARMLRGQSDGAAKLLDVGPTPKDPSARRSEAVHPLLGARVQTSSSEVVFAAEYDAQVLWALAEHRLRDGLAVLPGTGYLEIARAAGRALLGEGPLELSDVVFLSPLAVADGSEVEVRCRLRSEGTDHAFEIVSRATAGAAWHSHAQGRIARASEPARAFDLEAARRRTPGKSPIGARLPQEDHLRFGPRWHVLQDARFGEREALARFELGAAYESDLESHALHPAILDVATGFALPLAAGWKPDRFFAPFAYRSVRVHGPLPARGYSHVRVASDGGRGELALFDVTITDERGRVCVEIDEFAVRALEGTAALARTPAAGAAEDRGSQARRDASPSPDALMEELVRCGILPHEGQLAFERALAQVSGPEVVITSVEPRVLAERIARAARDQQSPRSQFARPELASSFVAPRNALESRLAQMWQELLGVDKVGVRDDFFELGGYSLIAVRLFARIKKEYQLEFPISLLFEAPTVEACAARIREELGETEESAVGEPARGEPGERRPKKLPFLVPLSSNRADGKTPFFLVAGMYGNVMNLRHLAGHLGADQLVYGIQAKGLDGQESPHATFEEMAADYLRDVRKLQPTGPYLLGGYSGGGITAYEMAQQLVAAGEEVGVLVLLDTPIPASPAMTYAKRLRLARQRISRQGAAFFTEAVVRKFGAQKRQLRLLVNKPLGKLRPYEFREANIEGAFYAALSRYRMRPYAGTVTLFRPPLEEAYVLGPGHVVNLRGEWVEPFNGWKDFALGGVDVHVVPGNHDNMVLEPNVRVLASKLRVCLAKAREEPVARPDEAVRS